MSALASATSLCAEVEFAPPDVSPNAPVPAMWSEENAKLLLWIYEDESCKRAKYFCTALCRFIPAFGLN